jgi:hypothetical protein
MSSIVIECRKNKYDEKKDKADYKSDTKNSLGDELEIRVDQWFMDTKKFFNSVKPTLEKYFDSIEKK